MKRLDPKTLLFLVVLLWILSGSLQGWEKPEEELMRLTVTKPILTEYVEDRLRQLEGKENLTENEAEELDFIRKNRDDPKSLADFYGMEIKEGQEQKGVEIQEKREPVVESSVGGANYTVNLGSFREKIRADRYVEELEKEGLEAFRWEVDLPGKGKWHRVSIGNFSTREQAELFAGLLEQKGFTPFVVESQAPQESADIP